MAERRGQHPQGEAGEAASVTAVKEYAHEETADVTGLFVLQEPPWYGTVCPVVWEDGGSNPASYPMPWVNINRKWPAILIMVADRMLRKLSLPFLARLRLRPTRHV